MDKEISGLRHRIEAAEAERRLERDIVITRQRTGLDIRNEADLRAAVGTPVSLEAPVLISDLTAEQAEQEAIANRIKGGPSLNDLFDLDFPIWAKTVSKMTAANMRRDWDNHIRCEPIACKPGGLFTEDEARDLILSLPLAKDGKRRLRRVCKNLTKRLVGKGYRHDNPFPDIRLPKDRTTEDELKYYKLEEYAQLLEAAKAAALEAEAKAAKTGRSADITVARSRRQLLDVLLIGGNTGLRPDELKWLRWEDVNLDTRKMTVRRTSNGSVKSGKPKTVDLLPGAVEAFEAMARNESGWIFPSKLGKPRNRQAEFGLRKLSADLGIEYKGVYGLRHFFAVMLATGGFGVQFTRKEAATLMRHESMSSIDVYYALTDDHIAKKAQQCTPLDPNKPTQV